VFRSLDRRELRMVMTKTRSPDDAIPAQLEKVLAQPDIARALFFPIDRASWRERKRRYFVKRRDRRAVRSAIGGVRFQCSKHDEPGTSAVTDCQNDVVQLVRSLTIVRQAPELAGAVLSKDVLLHRQLGRADGKRAKFGLFVPIDDRFRDDTAAARENYRRIERAISKAGFTVIQPEKPFDSQTGMDGLLEWARQLRLRKRRNYWWLLLLLLPALWFLHRDSPTAKSSAKNDLNRLDLEQAGPDPGRRSGPRAQEGE
jgi:hypothetical protein